MAYSLVTVVGWLLKLIVTAAPQMAVVFGLKWQRERKFEWKEPLEKRIGRMTRT
jgi:hypothetical protein